MTPELLALLVSLAQAVIDIAKAGADEDARHAAILHLNRLTADEIAKRVL